MFKILFDFAMNLTNDKDKLYTLSIYTTYYVRFKQIDTRKCQENFFDICVHLRQCKRTARIHKVFQDIPQKRNPLRN